MDLNEISRKKLTWAQEHVFTDWIILEGLWPLTLRQPTMLCNLVLRQYTVYLRYISSGCRSFFEGFYHCLAEVWRFILMQKLLQNNPQNVYEINERCVWSGLRGSWKNDWKNAEGNRGLSGKQGFHSPMVTPWPLQEQHGCEQTSSHVSGSLPVTTHLHTPPPQSEEGRMWSIPVSATDGSQRPLSIT